jgi:hypothetical protein
VHMLRDIDDPAAQFTNVNVDYISVSGPELSQEIFQRLKSCIENHVNCPKPDESCLPTRTIDVHPEGGDDRVCIHITRTEDRFKYVALSYSWGGTQKVTTTKATLIDRQHGIRLYNLPPTIQDAIQDSFLASRPTPQCWTLPYFLPDAAFGTLWIRTGFLIGF